MCSSKPHGTPAPANSSATAEFESAARNVVVTHPVHEAGEGVHRIMWAAVDVPRGGADAAYWLAARTRQPVRNW
jgi:hypothetical protein